MRKFILLMALVLCATSARADIGEDSLTLPASCPTARDMQAVIEVYISSHADMWRLEMRKRACTFGEFVPKKENSGNLFKEVDGAKIVITPLKDGGFGVEITFPLAPKGYWDNLPEEHVFRIGLQP